MKKILLIGVFLLLSAFVLAEPDLVIENVETSQPDSVIYGYVEVEFDLKNIGDEAATTNFEYKVEDSGSVYNVDKRASYETAIIYGAERYDPEGIEEVTLEPGESVHLKKPENIKVRDSGTYILTVTADPLDKIEEDDEGNNIVEKEIFLDAHNPVMGPFAGEETYPVPTLDEGEAYLGFTYQGQVIMVTTPINTMLGVKLVSANWYSATLDVDGQEVYFNIFYKWLGLEKTVFIDGKPTKFKIDSKGVKVNMERWKISL